MGGWGSGSWQSGKSTTSDMRAIDVRRLQRDGLLRAGHGFMWRWSRGGEEVGSIQIRVGSDRITLNYRARSHGEEWQPLDYPIHLEWTPCHFGGRRAWFRCPARGCGRRVAIVYGGTIFACRRCHRLAYSCQRETPDDRWTRRADKIRDRLDWEPGILNGPAEKPKGMHWRTYERLCAEHDAYADASLAHMALRFGLFLGD